MHSHADAQQEMIGRTESVCPVCLRTIPAQRVKIGGEVFLNKTCSDHGFFSTVIWRGKPSFFSWHPSDRFEGPEVFQTKSEKGCPHDCGLCSQHRQQSCCVLLEVTRRCNLKCPVCYADAGRGEQTDPSLEALKKQMQVVRQAAGDCHILLSGGEPTVRDDLPQIIAAARSTGFTFFQLNTNGIRLADDPDYIRDLKGAGLSTVFLQFDGLRDDVYEQIRGRALLRIKQKAIENCARYEMGVVLVPTLIPGINTQEIGGIIRYAIKGLPAIRGVHFQPVSYFGRNLKIPADRERITLPEVMTAIEIQTGGQMKADQFIPTGCESALCSFHGDFLASPDGTLSPLSPKKESCCCGPAGAGGPSVQKNRNFVKNRWALKRLDEPCCGPNGSGSASHSSAAVVGVVGAASEYEKCTPASPPPGRPGIISDAKRNEYSDWDAVLDQMKNRRITISCMAFQDADNLDLERLRQCCLHVVDHNRIIPFCAYNLTNRSGQPLYRD